MVVNFVGGSGGFSRVGWRTFSCHSSSAAEGLRWDSGSALVVRDEVRFSLVMNTPRAVGRPKSASSNCRASSGEGQEDAMAFWEKAGIHRADKARERRPQRARPFW